MSVIKIAILEKDGVEFDLPTEYVPQAEDIRFTCPGFTATEVRAAIVEVLGKISGNIDGGQASSIYLPSQRIDGGGA
jgi:hypothetical protein